MRRRPVVAFAVVIAAGCGLARAPVASAACADQVVVDDRVLTGSEVDAPRRLPPAAGTYPAISPACNDTGGDEPGRETTVVRLRGVPPRIAVGRRGRPGVVYLADGSLARIGTHPLHAALFADPRTPSYRAHRRCRPFPSAVRGRVLEDGVLRVQIARRTVFVSADAATRFANRPAYEPVLQGQRLRMETSRCGPRRVADRVTFVGTAPPPEPIRTDGRAAAPQGPHLDDWQVVLIGLAGATAGLIGLLWWQLGRD
jgi:hypothetical protein